MKELTFKRSTVIWYVVLFFFIVIGLSAGWFAYQMLQIKVILFFVILFFICLPIFIIFLASYETIYLSREHLKHKRVGSRIEIPYKEISSIASENLNHSQKYAVRNKEGDLLTIIDPTFFNAKQKEQFFLFFKENCPDIILKI